MEAEAKRSGARLWPWAQKRRAGSTPVGLPKFHASKAMLDGSDLRSGGKPDAVVETESVSVLYREPRLNGVGVQVHQPPLEEGRKWLT